MKFLNDRKGAVAVEFALIAPVFVLAITMTAELGLAAYDKMKLTAGVRSATQYVLQGGTDNTVIASIVKETAGFTPTTTIQQYCACSTAPQSAVACSGTCSSGTMRNYTSIESDYERTTLLKKFKLQSKVEFRSS